MSVKNIDFDLRRLNSLVWRILLIIILLTGIYRNFNTISFSIYYYYLASIVYLILFITQLYINEKIRGFFRLLLDLTLIIFFTYNRNLNDVIIFLPYLILVINSVNFSGSKNRHILFFLLVNIALLISANFKIYWALHFALVITSILMLIFSLRKIIHEFNNLINNEIGNLFFKNFDKGEEHKILITIKDRINNSKPNLMKIKEIFIFTKRGENLILIKGTKFINSNPVFNDNVLDILNKNQGNFEKIKEEIFIDNNSYKSSYWIRLKITDIDYFFMIDSSYSDSIFLNALKPIFNQIARVYQISYVLKNLRKIEADVIKDKISYVFDSINALHFVKNKLSPVTLKLSLIDRYINKKNDYSAEKIEEMRLELAQTDPQIMRTIFNRAEILIRGVDNIILKEDGSFKLGKIIDLVKDEWIYQFNDWNGLKINIDKPQSYVIQTNLETLGYIFGDLIANIEKYSLERRELNIYFSELKDMVVFEFLNDIKDFDRVKTSLVNTAKIYNEEHNDEIYNRTTKGLSLVRRLSRYKQIKTEVQIDTENQLYKFFLYLKT